MATISYSTMATPELDGTQAIKLGKYYGFDGVDLRVSNIKGELTESSTDREVLELKKVFEGEGIKSSSLFCYNQQATKEEDSWEPMRQAIVRLLEIGSILGTDIIRIQPGNPRNFADPEGFLSRLADTLAGILENDTGTVSIGIQNHVSMSPRALEIAQLARQINSPRFGLVFCPTSSVIKGDNLKAVLAGIKSCTKQLYVADSRRGEDGKFAHKLPGQGDIPLDSVYQGLGGEDFKGWITLKYEKIWEETLENHSVSLPAYVDFLRKAWGLTMSGK